MQLNLTDDKSTLLQVIVGAIRQPANTSANVDLDLCRLIESTKTTSMEDVSTGVLKKIKNI